MLVYKKYRSKTHVEVYSIPRPSLSAFAHVVWGYAGLQGQWVFCCLNSKLQLKCLKAFLVLIAVSYFSNELHVRTRWLMKNHGTWIPSPLELTVVILSNVISLCSLTNYDQMGAENKVHLIHIWKSVSKSEQSVLVSWGIMGSTRPGQRVCFTRPGYLLSLGAKCQAHPSSLSLPLVHPNFFEAANNFSMSFSESQEFSLLCLEWYQALSSLTLLSPSKL